MNIEIPFLTYKIGKFLKNLSSIGEIMGKQICSYMADGSVKWTAPLCPFPTLSIIMLNVLTP